MEAGRLLLVELSDTTMSTLVGAVHYSHLEEASGKWTVECDFLESHGCSFLPGFCLFATATFTVMSSEDLCRRSMRRLRDQNS